MNFYRDIRPPFVVLVSIHSNFSLVVDSIYSNCCFS